MPWAHVRSHLTDKKTEAPSGVWTWLGTFRRAAPALGLWCLPPPTALGHGLAVGQQQGLVRAPSEPLWAAMVAGSCPASYCASLATACVLPVSWPSSVQREVISGSPERADESEVGAEKGRRRFPNRLRRSFVS